MTQPLFFFLVDDDADDVLLFQEVVNSLGRPVQFASAGDGFEALQILRQTGSALPDLLFLDLNMPRMSGKECLQELKRDDRLRNIPVIMYTTSSQSKDIEETMMKGAVCFITKPTSVRELRQILSEIASSMPGNLEKTLRSLSNTSNTFIVC